MTPSMPSAFPQTAHLTSPTPPADWVLGQNADHGRGQTKPASLQPTAKPCPHDSLSGTFVHIGGETLLTLRRTNQPEYLITYLFKSGLPPSRKKKKSIVFLCLKTSRIYEPHSLSLTQGIPLLKTTKC